VVADIRTGQNTKKVALTQRGARAADVPLVVPDGSRGVEHGEMLLNAMLKIAQRRGINVELPLQGGAHLSFHMVDLPECKHALANDTPRLVRMGTDLMNRGVMERGR